MSNIKPYDLKCPICESRAKWSMGWLTADGSESPKVVCDCGLTFKPGFVMAPYVSGSYWPYLQKELDLKNDIIISRFKPFVSDNGVK